MGLRSLLHVFGFEETELSNMIERVARAIYFRGDDQGNLAWMHARTERKEVAFEQARAAIESIHTGMTLADDEFMRMAVKGYHDIADRDWQSSMPRDFFWLAISNWMKASLKEQTK